MFSDGTLYSDARRFFFNVLICHGRMVFDRIQMPRVTFSWAVTSRAQQNYFFLIPCDISMNHKKKWGEYEVFKRVDWVEEKAKLDREKGNNMQG